MLRGLVSAEVAQVARRYAPVLLSTFVSSYYSRICVPSCYSRVARSYTPSSPLIYVSSCYSELLVYTRIYLSPDPGHRVCDARDPPSSIVIPDVSAYYSYSYICVLLSSYIYVLVLLVTTRIYVSSPPPLLLNMCPHTTFNYSYICVLRPRQPRLRCF